MRRADVGAEISADVATKLAATGPTEIGAGVGSGVVTHLGTAFVGSGARLAQQEQAAPGLAEHHRCSQAQHGQHHQQRTRPAQQACRAAGQRMADCAARGSALALASCQRFQRCAGAQHQQRTQPDAQRATTEQPAIACKRAPHHSPDKRQQPEGR